MRVRDVVGPIIVVGFVTLFVFMLNTISAPDATLELGNFVIIADLIIAFILLMVFWEPVIQGTGRFEDVLPFRVPSWVGIPLGVGLFVFLYVSGLGELLLHVNEIASPALALAVAALILGGATYLSTRPDTTPTTDGPHANEAADAPAAHAEPEAPEAALAGAAHTQG